MMGREIAFDKTDIPVTKTSSAILALDKNEAYAPDKNTMPCSCIRCGKCAAACFMGLMPMELSKYAASGKMELFERRRGFECADCGSCTYICPSKRDLSMDIRMAKAGGYDK
jgi:electron transport complex protein RnfC